VHDREIQQAAAGRGDTSRAITYHDAEKYKATILLPLNAEAVGTPVVLGLVNILGPKREVLQCCCDAMMQDARTRTRE
jgi:hypothetical protein